MSGELLEGEKVSGTSLDVFKQNFEPIIRSNGPPEGSSPGPVTVGDEPACDVSFCSISQEYALPSSTAGLQVMAERQADGRWFRTVPFSSDRNRSCVAPQ
jgi:hypothetical protein